MKKITDKEIAEILGITRQTLISWKKQRPDMYRAIRSYFLLEKNNFFSNFKKIKALAELIKQDSDSKYIEDLVKLIEEGDEVICNI